ncbi:hypothetical protein [Streptomyces sp. BE303]|uniref:hypothetical protein n=1 Tax=Streptomyces sp. BE303 TaxID=3002528 RepID=UPI002E759B53|nr:hypothetical protein [Streptomyces sp. BE303]MED7949318.1 hypothetical protein [Streptomyces sp. BE303]
MGSAQPLAGVAEVVALVVAVVACLVLVLVELGAQQSGDPVGDVGRGLDGALLGAVRIGDVQPAVAGGVGVAVRSVKSSRASARSAAAVLSLLIGPA